MLGVGLAFWAAPFHAQETVLQASFAGRSYVLVREGGSYALMDDGADAAAVPLERGTVLDSVAALQSGWLLSGRRSATSAKDKTGDATLVLLRGGENGIESLPVPPTGAAVTMGAQALVDAGELVGLVWLEGSDASTLGVRAAAWSGSGFSAAEWVAAPIDGSQLALSSAVLADGSWLLVWSAFDGVDDEIRWSRHDGTTWSAPARLHADNRVPDITPVVAATADGAIVAWSRYDAGSYRGYVMRFAATVGWRGEQRVGTAHTVFPFFATDDSGTTPLLVFRAGVEGRWDLIELDGAGAVKSRSRWAGDPERRPVVRRGAAGSPRLEWIAEAASRSSAP